jgi:hypothetical protein
MTMKMMQFLALALVVGGLTFGLTGCEKPKETTAPPTEPKETVIKPATTPAATPATAVKTTTGTTATPKAAAPTPAAANKATTR